MCPVMCIVCGETSKMCLPTILGIARVWISSAFSELCEPNLWSFNFSEPKYVHLFNGHNNIICLVRSL